MPERDLAASLAAQSETLPRPDFSACSAREWLNGLPEHHPVRLRAVTPSAQRFIQALADHSPYLWRLLVADADRLATLLGRAPRAALSACLERMSAGCADAQTITDIMAALRRAKAEVALLVALADLGGAWTLEQVTAALTDFADHAVRLAVAFLLRDAVRDGKLVAADEPVEAGCGFAVLALGKGGARELNYSSDIDLVLFFDPAAPRLALATVPPVFYVRLAKALVRILGERTSDGYVLRVDLRLRPDPGSTSIAVSWPAALNYYEASGQTWERAAFIKARPVAGDLALGAKFLSELAPFVWRRYFDYAAVEDNAGLALGERSWACPSCGAVLDRDGNAAENLRRLGLAAVADGPVPDDLRAWERWIADARASVAEWRADRERSDDGGQGGLPRSDAGERVDRAVGDRCREALVEPRTRTARLRRGRGDRNACSPAYARVLTSAHLLESRMMNHGPIAGRRPVPGPTGPTSKGTRWSFQCDPYR